MAGLTFGDKNALTRTHWAILAVNALFMLIAAFMTTSRDFHLFGAVCGWVFRYESIDERLLTRQWIQYVSWPQFVKTCSLRAYLCNQSPFLPLLVTKYPLWSLKIGVSCLSLFALWTLPVKVSYLLAATPLFLFMRSAVLHDSFAFAEALLGMSLTGVPAGVLIGAAAVTKYYYILLIPVILLRGDLQAGLLAGLICGGYLAWLRSTRLWHEQTRFLRTLAASRTMLTRGWLTNRVTRFGFALCYLFPLLCALNLSIGLCAVLLFLEFAQIKYYLLLWCLWR